MHMSTMRYRKCTHIVKRGRCSQNESHPPLYQTHLYAGGFGVYRVSGKRLERGRRIILVCHLRHICPYLALSWCDFSTDAVGHFRSDAVPESDECPFYC
ncbi:hypothetical protein BDZ94DRAFT_899330 [Collybia nuda]|uniref:Ig-like domain-containing protein n=1 Tax=Collybia nuda TaxID=64659 RepID=A0A9P5YF41_9AGAR|nr:hypothetical protein BDZ94DRAFT_899330 [Collybia nuda]